jgi:hypothetical protein
MKIKISKSQWDDMGKKSDKKSDKKLFVKSNRDPLIDVIMEGSKIFNESIKNNFKNPNSRECKQYLMGVYERRHSGVMRDIIISNVAIMNINFPKEMLVEILQKNDDQTASLVAAGNPSCPPYMLAKVLSRNKIDEISYEAFENPYCPPNARVDWYINTKQTPGHDKFIDNIMRESIDRIQKKDQMGKDIKSVEEFWLDKKNKGEIDEVTNEALETHLRDKKK